MKLEMEIEKDLGTALWHIFHERGDGDVMQGRSKLVMSAPSDEEWEAGFTYVNTSKKKGERRLDLNLVPYANQIYAGTLVSICLDAYWYDNGLPTIELGHKLASSLLMTKVPKDVLDDIQMPFPAFRINVPSGLMNFTDGEVLHIKVGDHIKPALDNGEPVMGTAFAVRVENGGTYSIAEDLPRLLQMNYKDHVKLPFDIEPEYSNKIASSIPIKVKDEDATRLSMVSQLIAGVCLYMTGGDDIQFPVKKVGKAHSTWNGNRREPGPPLVRTFRMTRPVVHDFRQMVSDYCHGKSSKMTVQTHVTGHWKNQAYGRGRMLRKRLYIEPYWKGSVDAPIAQRVHIL